MKYSVEYSVGSDDGCSIGFKKEEAKFNGATVTVNFRYITLVITIITVVTMGNKILTNAISTNNPETVSQGISATSSVTAVSSVITNQGFVFEDSDVRLITREDVLTLHNSKDYSFKELLALGRNELYARHGQIFSEGEFYDLYYRQYDWYKETCKHSVEWSEFNDIEKANLRLLIATEEEYGFRIKIEVIPLMRRDCENLLNTIQNRSADTLYRKRLVSGWILSTPFLLYNCS